MRDLYKRLTRIGFDRPFVQNFFLPDWWNDELAEVPANRALAEMAIARQLGLRLDSLRNPDQDLVLPSVVNFRLKRNKGTTPEEVLPALHVAQRAAKLVAGLPLRVGGYEGPLTAAEARDAILGRDGRVDLRTLTRFCWDRGIIVLHLATLPGLGKKLDGLAMFCEERPVIVLASARKGIPWLAFHLAHELGHLLLGHVKPGDPPLVDRDLGEADDDQQEREADEFACQVLTGHSDGVQFRIEPDMKPDEFAERAVSLGMKEATDPGTVVLCCARSSGAWAIARVVLKNLGLNEGAHQVIATELHSRLEGVEIPAAAERFMEILSTPV